MRSLCSPVISTFPGVGTPHTVIRCNSTAISRLRSCLPLSLPAAVRCFGGPPGRHQHRSRLFISNSEIHEEDDEELFVEPLRVPETWMLPSNALQESEWLRATLHKWLDDEYCPEETNVEISKVAAQSFYESLLAKTDDLGEILLNMVTALQSVSFQESFHGAFSSANAAVHLITARMESATED